MERGKVLRGLKVPKSLQQPQVAQIHDHELWLEIPIAQPQPRNTGSPVPLAILFFTYVILSDTVALPLAWGRIVAPKRWLFQSLSYVPSSIEGHINWNLFPSRAQVLHSNCHFYAWGDLINHQKLYFFITLNSCVYCLLAEKCTLAIR